MVKTLQDLCLFCVARHIADINRLGNYLSHRHKEMLIERMCWHGLFVHRLLPAISYHLFSDTLQRVELSNSQQVDDATLDLLATCGCHPVSIVIQNCPLVTDKGIGSLGKINLLHKTQFLTISCLKKLSGSGLKSLSARAVTELDLSECSSIVDEGLIEFIQKCPNTEKLKLAEMHKLTDSSILAIAKALGSRLKELDCSAITLLTSQSTSALAKHCPNLKMLSLESCVKLDGQGLLELAERCSLQSLNISFCYKMNQATVDTLISMLRAKGSLESLELMGLSVGDLGMEFVASCSSLTRIILGGVKELTDSVLEMLCKQKGQTLLELDISSCQCITDCGVDSIARHMHRLESLGMRSLRELTGMGLCDLFQDQNRAINFTSISFSGSKNLSPIVVEKIATHCCRLETLLLAGLKGITDDIIFTLAHNCPTLLHLSVRNCQLTDAAICELATYCSRLKMLAVAGIHDLTDKSIFALTDNCPHITELYLSGCAKITRAALTYLKDCTVPHVWLRHDTPNAPIGLLMAKDLDTGEYRRMDDEQKGL